MKPSLNILYNMDAQKLKFLLSIQERINTLAKELGPDHTDVVALSNQFYLLYKNEEEHKQTANGHPDLTAVKNDTSAIRSHLELRGDLSVDYEYVDHVYVKKQLKADNLRMENIRLSLSIDENTRFFSYCVYTFYQVEELINYFFYKKYSVTTLKQLLENNAFDNKSQFGDIDKISAFPMSAKIKFFEKCYYSPTDSKGKKIYHTTLNLLRNIRNEEAHRCNVESQDNQQILADYERLLGELRKDKQKRKTNAEWTLETKAKMLQLLQQKNYTLIYNALLELNDKVKTHLLVTT